MERRVEARDLRQRRRPREQRTDRREVVRLVQWRERHQLFELREDRGVDPHRLREGGAAMHDTMAYRTQHVRGERIAQVADQELHRAVVAERVIPRALGQRRPGRVPRQEPGPGREALELPALHERRLARPQREERELEARRAGVEDEDGVGHAGASYGLGSSLARRSCATSCITAADARRVRSPSARDVSTIGTRTPSTMPAPSAPAK